MTMTLNDIMLKDIENAAEAIGVVARDAVNQLARELSARDVAKEGYLELPRSYRNGMIDPDKLDQRIADLLMGISIGMACNSADSMEPLEQFVAAAAQAAKEAGQ